MNFIVSILFVLTSAIILYLQWRSYTKESREVHLYNDLGHLCVPVGPWLQWTSLSLPDANEIMQGSFTLWPRAWHCLTWMVLHELFLSVLLIPLMWIYSLRSNSRLIATSEGVPNPISTQWDSNCCVGVSGLCSFVRKMQVFYCEDYFPCTSIGLLRTI